MKLRQVDPLTILKERNTKKVEQLSESEMKNNLNEFRAGMKEFKPVKEAKMQL